MAPTLARRWPCGPAGAALAGLLALALAPGCSAVESLVPRLGAGPQPGQPGYVRGFLGGVAAEEPRAALVAREVLSAGGSATDAAVAAGLTLAVTLPSRAGLGGGGACLVFEPGRRGGGVEAVVFPAGGRTAALPPGTDRPAAVPMLARGLFALHTRGGRRPFEELLAEAERLARLGTPVSRALARDLAAVQGPLFADPGARAVFARPDGAPLAEGDRLVQPDLAATLTTLRISGVGDLYQGALARRLAEASARAGGGLTLPELREGVPQVLAAPQVRAGNDTVAFLPPEADGGRGAVAQAWQRGGGDPARILVGGPADGGGGLGASTALVTLDRDGGAVACAFSMNNLFGTGRVAQGTGILLAAAPNQGAVAPAPLAATLASNASLRAFRAAVAASGQQAAPLAAAATMARILQGAAPAEAITAAPEPARVVAIGCARYLPGRPESCAAASDPRGAGAAFGGAER
ncbi:gamma-glutamyltransferase [Caldovatus aquaticus]|uniref:Gamma-glutamyltransferase n=1 Tax=Caldovatus aquaticus TaxID=2865671 RepID=A0ABS7F6Z6_9PROT|nr:gamma-glutamyltransferase [Caldovatus aquaticus]MBW8271093.1 gamma-glutamyltransferase [Caldovatus aquaticus]